MMHSVSMHRAAEDRESAVDPIFVALKSVKEASAAYVQAFELHDEACGLARAKHGDRPRDGISWRQYSDIGLVSIERERKDRLWMLKHGLTTETASEIEAEYLDAKARLREASKTATAWDRRAGILGLRRDKERRRDDLIRAEAKMARTVPTTLAGAAALLAFTYRDSEAGDSDWHRPALRSVLKALQGDVS